MFNQKLLSSFDILLIPENSNPVQIATKSTIVFEYEEIILEKPKPLSKI